MIVVKYNMSQNNSTETKHLFNNLNLSVVIFVSFLSLLLGVYNTYLIKTSRNSQNVGPNGQKLLPIKELIKKIDPNARKIGNTDSKVVMVAFEDFKCQYCRSFHNGSFLDIKTKYIDTGKISFVHQDFAFLGLESILSAEAAQCAGDQNKFWEYRDVLYAEQNKEGGASFNDASLKRYAKNLGLNQTEFDSCYDGRKYKELVEKTQEFARSYGISATPTFVINGQIIKGAMGIGTFEEIIDSELSK